MKILVTDGLEKKTLKKLEKLGHEVIEKHYEGPELDNAVKDADIIIVRSATKIRKSAIDSASSKGRLKMIIRAGVGTDNIDVEYAEENGIQVKNTPRASSDAVAELAIAHMLCLARFIGDANITMKKGQWNKKKYTGIELSGKKLGLVGFGRIARETARKARALGMKIYYTNRVGDKNYSDYKWLEFDELLKKADFISIHVPYDENTCPLISDREFSLMKEGAFLVNTARGGVVDEKALLKALENGKIAGAGMDVFENEPEPDRNLVEHPLVIATPHIGASTNEARARIGVEVLNIIKNMEE